jgi:hypothetical protein
MLLMVLPPLKVISKEKILNLFCIIATYPIEPDMEKLLLLRGDC